MVSIPELIDQARERWMEASAQVVALRDECGHLQKIVMQQESELKEMRNVVMDMKRVYDSEMKKWGDQIEGKRRDEKHQQNRLLHSRAVNRDEKIMVYPTISLAGGENKSQGFTMGYTKRETIFN
eukprot:TRINITY_DN19967_c0_g1_i1.p1 TRINITY_DN19967_c0_g1~~TRINITY_DN19967_c0_g1_i1.p1  ORF type:complete len:125 (+),score=28.81 TRINITY_DN19967_c0_g1_i1:229-603(+)